MWDDFHIGDSKSNSARTVRGNISENSVSYWWGDDNMFRLDGVIDKDTPEGERIKEILNHVPTVELDKEVFKVVYPHIDPEKVIEAIKIIREEAYDDGYQTAQFNIRQALGIKGKS